MSKQDKHGARTPGDVVRQYILSLGKSFAEVMGIAKDTRKFAEDTAKQMKGELALKVGKKDNGQVISMINASADLITIKGNRLVIISDNFELTKDGKVIAKAGEIGGCTIKDGVLRIGNANIAEKLTAEHLDATDLEFMQGTVGNWHLGEATIWLNRTTSMTDYALYTDTMEEMRAVQGEEADIRYQYQVALTAKGVYVWGRYDGKDAEGNPTDIPYYSNKTWLDICEP